MTKPGLVPPPLEQQAPVSLPTPHLMQSCTPTLHPKQAQTEAVTVSRASNPAPERAGAGQDSIVIACEARVPEPEWVGGQKTGAEGAVSR